MDISMFTRHGLPGAISLLQG